MKKGQKNIKNITELKTKKEMIKKKKKLFSVIKNFYFSVLN
jgi:hypothetical protein